MQSNDKYSPRKIIRGREVPNTMLINIRQQLSSHTPRRLDVEAPEAAVLIALTRHERDPEIVFTRRCGHLNTHGGEVAFPGGKRDPEDKSLLQTALRESHEEIGLPTSQVDFLGTTGDVISRFGIKVTPYVGVIDPDVELVANPHELDRIFRVPVSFFLESGSVRTDKLSYRHMTFHVPAWQFGEYQIWGLTAIMLVEFLNISLGANIPLDVPQTRGDQVENGLWCRQA
ncbi:CoA pyrophosphatase [Sansalvadorimonas sp. 2012CJ34-2]|uniref:CoA pyrophosphatase n=1 Tax=Parendozoicomonas callyspongiae TaxID=2942213 RepID=A0ABT0PKW4_9GAMM|nr:CoA pyrophosphatase [Sansalvadorimonas sp. 2012CJ34-2]MCL6272010.1 CoA pyrophosphatase [Sansalvadorimonas sp. 2012CJ34-2]